MRVLVLLLFADGASSSATNNAAAALRRTALVFITPLAVLLQRLSQSYWPEVTTRLTMRYVSQNIAETNRS
jgi:hypothetical protein